MSDRPTHDPEDSSLGLPSRNRRKLLLALGFGASNLAIGRALGTGAAVETAAKPPAASGSPRLDLTPVEVAGVSVSADPAELLVIEGAAPEPGPDHRFAMVITGGLVVDPESGFEGIVDVGIDDGVITAIGGTGYQSDTVIDAAGRVVAPGFIDLLSAEPNGLGEWNKLADGVTTNLAMHGVNNYAKAFFDKHEGTMPIHFGGAWHQQFIRNADNELGVSVDQSLSEAQLVAFERLTDVNLRNGFAGIAFSPEYAPGTTYEEIERLSIVARDLGHMAYFHLRYSEPGRGPEGVAEAIQLASDTGISVHCEHLASTGGTTPEAMATSIQMIDDARASGLDVTACVYPYDFWATTLGSTRFTPDWREKYGLDYADLEVAGTGTRLSAETFAQAQADNMLVAAHGSIPEETIEMALSVPWMMVGSDAILTPSRNNHPRASGTFARLLGLYVRDRQVLDLMPALAKATLLPAQRFQSMLPDLVRKGRLQRGASADVVVFDPATIADRATVAQPDLTSVGIDHVLVEGVPMLTGGVVQQGATPGRALKSVVR